MGRTDVREGILKVGSELIARGGFGQTGIDKILKKARVPKGSFYYYFSSKEDFGLAVIDRFGEEMLEHARKALEETDANPLHHLRAYLDESREKLRGAECKRGCLIGDLGQELAHQNEAFRKRIEKFFDAWKIEIVACLDAARSRRKLRPDADPVALADFILSGWEGAILRAKVKRSVEPLDHFIDVLFSQVLVP